MSSTLDYWPPIREAIATNNDPSQPDSKCQVRCPICLDDIAVTSFPPVPPREGDTPDIDPTQGEILLCGHVLCQACRTQNEQARGHERRCPMCRAELRCSDCGRPSKLMSIPKEGSSSTIPALAEGDDGSRCTDCNAQRWFDDMIRQGEWPNGLADLEPGFVPLFYHLAGKLEAQNYVITKGVVTQAFSNIVRDEFSTMVQKRAEAIYNRSVTTANPWFRNQPAATMNERTAPLVAGDEAMRRRTAHRQQLLQLLIDSYAEEISASNNTGPLSPEEAEVRHHAYRGIEFMELERRREHDMFENALGRGRSENDPADGDQPARTRRTHVFVHVFSGGADLNPGPRLPVNGMTQGDAMVDPLADMHHDDSLDIADVRLDDAMGTEANELPSLVDQFDLEEGEILEFQAAQSGLDAIHD
ncbi:hypothetical protein NW768_000926 [Fusarium equiseti]|uniref:RING-type domain-containing protein n=1 Tax=Fusarium equiseti TaxID=61235 RepID=A0ABQ8RUA5_FUSEQ|nr:hypothetical protein NW768_000926 [Fusarium equiseti]